MMVPEGAGGSPRLPLPVWQVPACCPLRGGSDPGYGQRAGVGACRSSGGDVERQVRTQRTGPVTTTRGGRRQRLRRVTEARAAAARGHGGTENGAGRDGRVGRNPPELVARDGAARRGTGADEVRHLTRYRPARIRVPGVRYRDRVKRAGGG